MVNIIGARIKYLRVRNGMTQKDLATLLNIGNNTLSQYESGKRVPGDDVKLKIAAIFDVTVDYLLGLTNDPGGVASNSDTSRASPAVVNQIALMVESNADVAEIMNALPSLTENQLNRILGYIQALQALSDQSDKSNVSVMEEKNA